MGRMQAEEMIGLLDFDAALDWHLRHNHYPAIHPDFFPAIKKAIEYANQEEWDHKIELPNHYVRSVSFIIRELHLEPFLDLGDDNVDET
jgi:hypothetical protein